MVVFTGEAIWGKCCNGSATPATASRSVFFFKQKTAYEMLVLSPTPTIPLTFQDSTEEIAFKLIMLERSTTLLALERSATVIDWPRNIRLSTMLTKVRRLRPVVAA